MKKITITNVDDVMQTKDYQTMTHIVQAVGPEEMDASDGYHTFTELYDHRIALFIALAKQIQLIFTAYRVQKDGSPPWENPVWRSKEHHQDADGKQMAMYNGWFIMGIYMEPGKQISYHLPLSYWDKTDFALTLDMAPPWDGHTPADVITRLFEL